MSAMYNLQGISALQGKDAELTEIRQENSRCKVQKNAIMQKGFGSCEGGGATNAAGFDHN
ncbi:hypothetical protein NT2_02_03430 [Caenibius tardaugens NBRC 16725]|uniref:Uncharacterized protein n=1 Tax=Caenibius tardaugens NBRC 16725 TaxID=1219035 RepID=U2Y550_9SPHN|nr:hypothetical protein NT2_02_03430 [Caenibius tardaugens NBRC 16725]